MTKNKEKSRQQAAKRSVDLSKRQACVKKKDKWGLSHDPETPSRIKPAPTSQESNDNTVVWALVSKFFFFFSFISITLIRCCTFF